jgi:GH35 family endo-1,4-beta-xylanase
VAALAIPAASQEAWQQEAQARIERHRQADAEIIVVDDAGQPVAGAEVHVAQTRHRFLFGCNFFQFGRLEPESDEESYRRQFAELFNFATLAFYWPTYEPRRGEPRHAYTEEVARWCREHGIQTKGHPLAWNYFEPRWLPDDLQAVRTLQMERIEDCVSRFRGLIDIWDVVNEATHYEREELQQRAPKLTQLWTEVGRVPFVDECFRHARAAHPQATLLINDYRVDPAYADLITALEQAAGARPYDVIGLQSHMHGDVWDNARLWDVCERFARFGVPLHFTELTVVSGAKGWELAQRGQPWLSTPEGEEAQARDVERIYTMLFSHPAVAAVTWWDFTDRHAWQRAPAGLLRQDLTPKPACTALLKLIKDRWWTRVQTATDTEGKARFRGFLGDYTVTVRLASGREITSPLTLATGDAHVHRVVVD